MPSALGSAAVAAPSSTSLTLVRIDRSTVKVTPESNCRTTDMSTSMRAAALVDVVSGNGRPPKALLEPTKMENQVEVQCSFQQIRQSTNTLGTLGTL